MERLALILVLFFSIVLNAQENSNVVNNSSQSMIRASNSTQSSYGSTTFFINPSREIMGSIYLFDTWNNNGVIYLDDKQRLVLNNVNINVQRNSFESKVSQDSIYTFNTNNIVKIIINNKTYKNFYSEDGKRIYEIIYESKGKYTILKGFKIRLIQGSANPMVNRKEDKFSRSESYFLKRGDNPIESFKLNKKKVLGIISDDEEHVAKMKKFMEDKNLSYKKIRDVKKGLDYIALN